MGYKGTVMGHKGIGETLQSRYYKEIKFWVCYEHIGKGAAWKGEKNLR